MISSPFSFSFSFICCFLASSFLYLITLTRDDFGVFEETSSQQPFCLRFRSFTSSCSISIFLLLLDKNEVSEAYVPIFDLFAFFSTCWQSSIKQLSLFNCSNT